MEQGPLRSLLRAVRSPRCWEVIFDEEARSCGCSGAGAGGSVLGTSQDRVLAFACSLVEATREAQRAVQHQTTELFGSEAEECVLVCRQLCSVAALRLIERSSS